MCTKPFFLNCNNNIIFKTVFTWYKIWQKSGLNQQYILLSHKSFMVTILWNGILNLGLFTPKQQKCSNLIVFASNRQRSCSFQVGSGWTDLAVIQLLYDDDDGGRFACYAQMSHACIYGVQAWGFAAWVWPLWADSRCLHPTWLLYTSTERICIHSISFP